MPVVLAQGLPQSQEQLGKELGTLFNGKRPQSRESALNLDTGWRNPLRQWMSHLWHSYLRYYRIIRRVI